MSTSLNLDFDLKTPACVEWKSNDDAQLLVDPDPQRDCLMLESRFVGETLTASFQLHCPIRVKGIESQSHIIGLIHTRSIVSFNFDENPEVPEIVRKKLNCKAVRLHFELCQPLDLVASTLATEPVQPRKRLSGQAFDALRSLAGATAFDIYVSAREISKAKLTAVHEAASQKLLQPLHPDISSTLASLYGNSAGRVISLSSRPDKTSTSGNEKPPSYDEIEPPPPPDLDTPLLHKSEKQPSVAAVTGTSNKKRRRLDDSSTSSETDDCHNILAALTSMRKEMHRLEKRVEWLEKENKNLNRELDDLRASCEKVTDAVEVDGTALLEVHEDLNELKEQVDFLAQGGMDSDVEEHIVETVKQSVLTHILESGYNTKITFEKS